MNPSSAPGNGPFLRAQRRAGWWRRLRGALAGLLGLGLAASPPAPAQAAQAAVPQHWISYAQLASNQFQAWLSDPEDPAVVRLHERLQQRMLEENRAGLPEPVVVRVWVAASGQVERVEFNTLGDVQADADLRGVLSARPLSEPPPRDMRQPMVLRLRLDVAT
ncbi:YbaB/EbfC family DNA-binding protein [Orrella sp. JC864]|uniref:YbaB/EbfC family DNA-binding protein n=1 Tax=Orrella sp. JC864 TaxID=3120298 RepID=UPI00300A632B